MLNLSDALTAFLNNLQWTVRASLASTVRRFALYRAEAKMAKIIRMKADIVQLMIASANMANRVDPIGTADEA